MAGKSVVLAAVGDIDLSFSSAALMQRHGIDWPFEKMHPVLARADVRFGNLECAILPPGYPKAKIDPKGLVTAFDGTPALKNAGFDVVNLAQNHILDAGTAGMFHTRKLVERLGIAAPGVGRTQAEARRMAVVRRGGLAIGFLCYAEDTNYSLCTRGPCHAYWSLPAVLEDVRRNRPKVDVLVVSIHADLEFMETPSMPRREAFRQVAKAGATLVLGHHPHVPQGVERVGRGLVAYSLGNFVFAAHTSSYMRENGPHTGHSFVLLTRLARGKVLDFERVPLVIPKPPDERPTPLGGAAARKMLAYFACLDRMVADDRIVAANWRAKAMAMLDAYIERFKTADRRQMLENWLGRLTLVAENRSWVNEVMAVVRENWDRQAREPNLHSRPHYRLMKRMERSAR